jgi:tetratricopeptide (TPR) repeat protein
LKKFLIIFLLILITFFVFIFVKIMPDVLTVKGKTAYQNKNYSKAYSVLKWAFFLNPKHQDARYYYIKTLIKLPATLHIQKEIYNISQINLADSANLIADMKISDWKKRILHNCGNNYIKQVPLNNKILRWDIQKFPIKVYITQTDLAPKYYLNKIKKAFLQWQVSTKRLINFQFTDNEKNADIIVNIKLSDDIKKCREKICKYSVAYTIPTISNNSLRKMNITFYALNQYNKPFSEKEIYYTALHEIGHALGIMGHSYNQHDIMHMEITHQINEENNMQSISFNDLNTVKLLYNLMPDITNTPLNKFNDSSLIFAPIILGSDKQINSEKILEAQHYIKSAPNISNGYIDLALAYAAEKQYNQAIEALNKALSFSSNNFEKSIVFYNFAVLYLNIKDFNKALEYAYSSQKEQDSADIEGLIALINYNLGNTEQAKSFYKKSLQTNPDNIINSVNLARIYLKEFNFQQAANVLNHLVEVNSEAEHNPMVKIYSPLMFLFK